MLEVGWQASTCPFPDAPGSRNAEIPRLADSDASVEYPAAPEVRNAVYWLALNGGSNPNESTSTVVATP
jgi:hypothetical protein